MGTGAGMPTKQRNVTAIALRFYENNGNFWLFDCGEGTQHQLMNSPLKLSKLEKIFITHLHGDHLYGLPGVLTSRSYQGGNGSLTVYGPKGLKALTESILQVSQARLGYALKIIEIEGGTILEDSKFTVRAEKLEHRIESFGYSVEEKERAGRLNVELLRQLGVPSGPIYGRLKDGEDVRLKDGRLLKSDELLGPSTPGRKVVIMGDTRICVQEKGLADSADVLVHEGTFASDLESLAHTYYHSTVVEAAQLAKEASVSTLILTHFSSRYQGEEAERMLLSAAQQVFHNTYLANDMWSYMIPRNKGEGK